MENTDSVDPITGNDRNLTCVRNIGGGGYGRVYEVLPNSVNTDTSQLKAKRSQKAELETAMALI
jgi:hypothetical protein